MKKKYKIDAKPVAEYQHGDVDLAEIQFHVMETRHILVVCFEYYILHLP